MEEMLVNLKCVMFLLPYMYAVLRHIHVLIYCCTHFNFLLLIKLVRHAVVKMWGAWSCRLFCLVNGSRSGFHHAGNYAASLFLQKLLQVWPGPPPP